MYKSKNHAKYSLKVHLVFSTKYRRNIFCNKEITTQLKKKIIDVSKKSNFKVEKMEVDKNHIHLLIDYEPCISVVQIVRKLKQETQNDLWFKFKKELNEIYWEDKHLFWSKGYFACSIGEAASYETIKKYIEEQG